MVRQVFLNGHYSLAVEEGFKYLNNLVKRRSGLEADGAGLMGTAFSLNSPVLRLSDLRTQWKRDQQLGYMQILQGSMTGIRNPRATSTDTWTSLGMPSSSWRCATTWCAWSLMPPGHDGGGRRDRPCRIGPAGSNLPTATGWVGSRGRRR